MTALEHFLNVLALLTARLEGHDINWVLTGSLAFALQGLPLEVYDIDIQTDATGAYKIEQLLADFSVRPVTYSATERIRSHFGALVVDAVPVEIMGDIEKRLPDGHWEGPVNLVEHKCEISVAGMRIPVLALAYEADSYQKLGRLERAQQLLDFARERGETHRSKITAG